MVDALTFLSTHSQPRSKRSAARPIKVAETKIVLNPAGFEGWRGAAPLHRIERAQYPEYECGCHDLAEGRDGKPESRTDGVSRLDPALRMASAGNSARG